MMLLPRHKVWQPQTNPRIVAQLTNTSPDGEELLGCDHALARAPEGERQTALAQDHGRIDARGLQAGLKSARDFERMHGR